MKQEKTTRLVGRFRVKDSQGEEHTVEEWGDFIRVQLLAGGWTDWSRSGGRLKLRGEHVNPTDDAGVFELAATGERLTLISPDQP